MGLEKESPATDCPEDHRNNQIQEIYTCRQRTQDFA
jgi:hypothetical protein